MAKKTIVYGSNALAFALVVFLMLAVINFLSYRRFVRADLTEDKRYTISPSTKNVIKRLDDVVTINAYYSREPAQVAERRRKIRDVLDEYRAYSNKLQINFIDPAGFNESEKQELRFRRITELQVNVIQKDKAEIANVYMSVAVAYGGKEEVLPVVEDTNTLEYDLTSAILKVTAEEAKTIGFLTGHEELDVLDMEDRSLEGLRRALDKNQNGQYNISKVTIQDGNAIDENISTLVVAGPKSTLTEREKYEIDQCIMRGGRAIFLIDSIRTQEASLQANPLSTGLNDLLEHYGIKLGNNLVLDRSSEMTRFQTMRGVTIQQYLYFIKVLKHYFYSSAKSSEGLSSEHIITSELESMVLPWASSLELVSREGDSIKATALAKTSQFSWTTQSPYNLDPSNRLNPPLSTQKAYIVAAALSGVFKSFYAGKDIPPVASDKSGADETPTADTTDRETKTESEPTQIVVVGNSKFLEQGREDGQIFFLNVVDWLTLGEDLINIRSHSVTDRPLREASEGEKAFIRFICIFGIPLIVVAFGLLRYFLRRRAKQLVEAYGTI